MPRLLLKQMTLFDSVEDTLKNKYCPDCTETKSISSFYKNKLNKDGHDTYCEDCRRDSLTKKREEERIKYKKIKRTLKRGDVSLEGLVFWGYDLLAKNFEHWVDKDRFEEKRKTVNNRRNVRYQEDPLYRFRKNLSKSISQSLNRLNGSKNGKSKCEIIGLNMVDFQKYLSGCFLEGMSWENRNEWHIDHILPLSAAKTQAEIKMLWHYTNIQPMWAIDNLVKGGKYCPVELEEFFKRRRLEMEQSDKK